MLKFDSQMSSLIFLAMPASKWESAALWPLHLCIVNLLLGMKKIKIKFKYQNKLNN
jgi:hypothetical protein